MICVYWTDDFIFTFTDSRQWIEQTFRAHPAIPARLLLAQRAAAGELRQRRGRRDPRRDRAHSQPLVL